MYKTTEQSLLFFSFPSLYILKQHLDECVRIPMDADARSLNLSNCVAIGIYEVLRQQSYPGLSKVEVQKGADFIYKE